MKCSNGNWRFLLSFSQILILNYSICTLNINDASKVSKKLVVFPSGHFRTRFSCTPCPSSQGTRWGLWWCQQHRSSSQRLQKPSEPLEQLFFPAPFQTFCKTKQDLYPLEMCKYTGVVLTVLWGILSCRQDQGISIIIINSFHRKKREGVNKFHYNG